ncbi:MAG: JAB domain-containing protein, partial [Gemmatimonadota bacterium]
MSETLGYLDSRPRARSRRMLRLTTLRLVREGSFPAPVGFTATHVPIRTPRDVFEYMTPYAQREAVESFWILTLDAQHCVSAAGPTVITRGILNSSLVHPREVFIAAIAARAVAVILVHNHPSGDPTPSADDRVITSQLVAAGK